LPLTEVPLLTVPLDGTPAAARAEESVDTTRVVVFVASSREPTGMPVPWLPMTM
jgi:hypothetical protein